MSDTDLELLARYTRHRAEDAFAELVRRHLALVHSAALRQVHSPQLAEEIAQSTFLKLAQHARQLAPGTILSAWLYQITRREAIDVVRREARRQLREQIATEMNAMNATAADWTHIEPLLDDAMHALDETDRAAVLLRYFENKSLREVGEALGASENAAQKRLTRAVEQLREFLAKRGVTAGASGLAVVISANAVQAAPVGLAVTISTAVSLAGTTAFTSATATTAKAIAMTTLQKSLVTVALVVTSATTIYQARQAAVWRAHYMEIHNQAGEQTQRERDDAMRRLAALDSETKRGGNTTELLRLRGEMARLRGLESDVAKLREESKRHQSEARKAMENLAAAQQGNLQFAAQRVTSINAMKQVGLKLRQLAAANNLAAAFTPDGKLNPNLLAETLPSFDLSNVELVVNDPSQLSKLIEEAPHTIVARTVESMATPDERWMRFYVQADGAVHNYSTPSSNQVFSANWQLEYLKP